ncbi:5'-nucleotidase /3'-nucleotidase /exopolyphosphatase [Sphingomonas guangdongensis]|uniref:5'-nucleotidase SurE n=1 Tax=Sphingomonas guangdongensis TaxID=1141890 RepID=A0A285QZW5_9SPHN|nr:5'/3'-nucleotidase SurE [Sphingomonas guangdongensis]SOB87048.1 5'-nucleotidase /3'-nucleotidase /exopolyphosphatase [Sphingomonas guangdongensis]
MRILLSNDDGVHAHGLEVLEALARTLSDDVTVVAPLEEQSGKGRSLTLTEPVRLRRFGEKRWAVTGTPTDAVMIALAEVMKDARPDLILSGVNRGANLGEDVSYSGTVAAAMEGALAGIPAIALSQRYANLAPGEQVSFAAAEAWGERVLRPLLATPLAPRTLVNVNFPPVPAAEVQGIKVVAQGLRDYGRLRLDKRQDPRGFPYFWLGLGRVPFSPVVDTDLEAIEAGYVTVTPLHLDLTHRPSLASLAAAFG